MHHKHIHSTGGRGGLTEAQLAAIVSLAADAIIVVDASQRIVFFNEGAERTFGHAAATVLGESLDVLLPERVRGVHVRHMRDFAGAPETARLMGERMRITALHADGHEFPAEASIAKVQDGDGGVVFLVVLRDVTDKAAAAAQLDEQRRQLEEAQRIAAMGSWEWAVGSDTVTWSDELYRIYGLAPGSVTFDFASFLQRVHPEDRANTRASIEAALHGGTGFGFEERIVRPDGSVRLLRSRGTVIHDATGAPQRLVGVCQDITEQRALETQARQLAAEQAARVEAEAAGRRMSFLAAASEELASSLDVTETLGTVARLAVPAIADWAAVDMIGRDGALRRLAVEHSDPARVALVREIERRYPPDPDAPRGVHHVLRTGEADFLPHISDDIIDAVAQDAEHARLIRELGLRSWLCVPLAGRERVLGAITLACAESGREFTQQDLLLAGDLGRRAAVAIETATLVAELQQAHEQLRQQAVQLEAQAEALEARNEMLAEQAEALSRLDRARSDFMATVSHELRTPLNAIIGYSDLLLEGVPAAVPPAARSQVERIRIGASHLLRLIEEILTFSSLEAGRQGLVLEDADTHRLIAELEAVVEPIAQQRGLDLRIGVGRVPPVMHTDPGRLRQVLLNLLGNAVKFTEHGYVALDVEQEGDDVVFHVRDSGIGIRPEDRPRLFEPFWQADQSRTRRSEGTGLGLAIANRLAALMGGSITVDSEPGRGSTFTLRVPVRTAAA
jgi:PAS domain S-box-containing protein